MIDTIVYESKNNLIRVAGLSNGRLDSIDIIDFSKPLEGNIYLGRIVKKIDLANGKTGYFVDLGCNKEAFINAEEYGRDDLNANEGQEVIVQVQQEQRAEKGPKLIRSLQFVGRNLVYCPYKMNVEVSNKIADKLKAEELRTIVHDNTTGQEGWIVRTCAVYADNADICEEMEVLRGKFDDVRRKAKTSKAPELLLERNNILVEIIDKNANNLQKVVVNDHNLESALAEDFETEFSSNPFDEYNLEDAIVDALSTIVNLKSGGRLVIEETKACVAIDVDSGDDNGQGNLNRLNFEAAEEIVRQIKLRNLSGKIVIDFAGASEYRFLKSAIDILENGLRKDNVKTITHGMSKSGLVEITRMRRRPSLRNFYGEECPTCRGSGIVEK